MRESSLASGSALSHPPAKPEQGETDDERNTAKERNHAERTQETGWRFAHGCRQHRDPGDPGAQARQRHHQKTDDPPNTAPHASRAPRRLLRSGALGSGFALIVRQVLALVFRYKVRS